MTIQEIKTMTIGLLSDGTPALCKTTRSGKIQPVRRITPEESAAICALLYTLHKTVHPDNKIMYLPFGEGKALAITEVETTKE